MRKPIAIVIGLLALSEVRRPGPDDAEEPGDVDAAGAEAEVD